MEKSTNQQQKTTKNNRKKSAHNLGERIGGCKKKKKNEQCRLGQQTKHVRKKRNQKN
jgi:hypothetical protein